MESAPSAREGVALTILAKLPEADARLLLVALDMPDLRRAFERRRETQTARALLDEGLPRSTVRDRLCASYRLSRRTAQRRIEDAIALRIAPRLPGP